MAMSRILAQSPLPRASLRPPTALFSHHRHLSDKTRRNHLVEAEADQPSDSPEAAAEVIAFGIRKLEDAIDSIIVRRSAPDWLPFLPGYSYWVPPRGSATRGGANHPAGSVVDVMGKLASSGVVGRNRGLPLDLMSDDEDAAFVSSRGWPSFAFYNDDGTSPMHHIPVVEVELKIQDNEDRQEDDTSDSEDEER